VSRVWHNVFAVIGLGLIILLYPGFQAISVNISVSARFGFKVSSMVVASSIRVMSVGGKNGRGGNNGVGSSLNQDGKPRWITHFITVSID